MLVIGPADIKETKRQNIKAQMEQKEADQEEERK